MNVPGATVSVIVPAWDRVDALRACLASLRRQRYPRGLTRIIVVDNGSPVPLHASLGAEFPEVDFIREPEVGPAAARNAGIRQASSEVVAFLDSDCEASEEWLSEGVSALQAHPGCAFVAGKIDMTLADPARPTAFELYDKTLYLRQDWYLQRRKSASSANLFTTRAMLDALGPFDVRLTGFEDYEWTRRAYRRGLTQVYSGGAAVRHPALRTFRQFYLRSTRFANAARQLPEVRAFDTRGSRRGAIADLLGRIRSESALSAWQKVQVLGVAVLMELIIAADHVRVRIGGRPRGDGGFSRVGRSDGGRP